MIYHDHVPAPPLDDFVDRIWYCELPEPTHEFERRLPGGTMSLVVNLSEECFRVYDGEPGRVHTTPGALMVGALSSYEVLDTRSMAAILGVHFKPGGAFPFLAKAPAGHLTDGQVSLEDLWGRAAASELRERLLEATTPAARFAIVERELRARVTRPLARHRAVRFALGELERTRGSMPLGEISQAVGLSARRLIEAFKAEVGLTPKLFGRILRFQSATETLFACPGVDHASLAVSCGYYDQAHLIRDFRAFAGMTPASYVRDRGGHPSHVPLASSSSTGSIPSNRSSTASGE